MPRTREKKARQEARDRIKVLLEDPELRGRDEAKKADGLLAMMDANDALEDAYESSRQRWPADSTKTYAGLDENKWKVAEEARDKVSGHKSIPSDEIGKFESKYLWNHDYIVKVDEALKAVIDGRDKLNITKFDEAKKKLDEASAIAGMTKLSEDDLPKLNAYCEALLKSCKTDSNFNKKRDEADRAVKEMEQAYAKPDLTLARARLEAAVKSYNEAQKLRDKPDKSISDTIAMLEEPAELRGQEGTRADKAFDAVGTSRDASKIPGCIDAYLRLGDMKDATSADKAEFKRKIARLKAQDLIQRGLDAATAHNMPLANSIFTQVRALYPDLPPDKAQNYESTIKSCLDTVTKRAEYKAQINKVRDDLSKTPPDLVAATTDLGIAAANQFSDKDEVDKLRAEIDQKKNWTAEQARQNAIKAALAEANTAMDAKKWGEARNRL